MTDLFTIENCQEIIQELQKRHPIISASALSVSAEALAADLNAMWDAYLGWKKVYDNIPTRITAIYKLAKHQRHIDKFLKNGRDLQKLLERIAPAALFKGQNLIDQVENMLEVVEFVEGPLGLLIDEIKTSQNSAFERTGAGADRHLFGTLLPEVFEKHFNHKAGASVRDGVEPYGPFITFASKVCKIVGMVKSSEAIKSDLAAMRPF